MPRADAAIPIFPSSGPTLDIDAAGVLLDARALVNVRNCFWQDDQTLTRRPGLWSHHLAFDDSESALGGETPSGYAVLGLFQFDRIKSAQNVSTVYLAKVNDYLIASRFGLNFDIPLANKLGPKSIPDFTEVYVLSERRNYVVICTNDGGFMPSYWSGVMPSAVEHTGPAGTPVSASLYDLEDFAYLKFLKEAGAQQFSVFHNGRLFMAGSDPFQVIYSSSLDFRDFANGGAFFANPEFGKVTGFFQTFFGELILGQEKAISRIVFADGVPAGSSPITTEVGLANNRAAIQRGQDFFFLGTDGQVWSLSAAAEFGDFLPATKSFPVFRKFIEGSLSARPSLWALDDVENHLAIFGISSGSGTMVDEVWSMDYARGERWTQIENKTIGPLACGAIFRYPRYGSKSKAVFGSYGETSGNDIGKIWEWNLHHKEDVALSSRAYAADSSTPNHLLPRLRFPPTGGGAAGWPTTGSGVQNDYTGNEGTTIEIECSVAGTVGAGTTAATWRDTAKGTTGSLVLGAAYTPGDWLTLTEAVEVKFGAVAITVGQQVWVLVDAGQSVSEVYRSDLPDLAEGMTHLQLDGDTDTATKNFVPIFETPALHVGSPDKDMQLEGITILTRAVGNRADTDTLTEALGQNQNQYRFSLDVSIKFDEDPEWQQIALLDGNEAKQYHLDRSLKENSGIGLREERWWSLQATEHTGVPFADELAVNIHRLKVGKRCKYYRLRFGQETMAIDTWATAALQDDIGAYAGDFKFVGFIPHVSVAEETPAIQLEGSLSKTWEL